MPLTESSNLSDRVVTQRDDPRVSNQCHRDEIYTWGLPIVFLLIQYTVMKEKYYLTMIGGLQSTPTPYPVPAGLLTVRSTYQSAGRHFVIKCHTQKK